jgi:hypothetical protein
MPDAFYKDGANATMGNKKPLPKVANSETPSKEQE